MAAVSRQVDCQIEIEEHKFRCMVRQLLRWKASGAGDLAKRWLDGSDLKGGLRSAEVRKHYADAANEQWARGNRGKGWVDVV